MRVDLAAKDWVLAGGGLLTLAGLVLAAVFPVWPGDMAGLAAVQDWQQPALGGLFRAAAFLGWMPVAVCLVAMTVVLLLSLRRRADAVLLLLLSLPMALAPLLKLPVGRPRPEYGITESLTLSLSYPSGHAAFATLFGGFLIYLVWQGGGRAWLRYGLSGGLLLLVLLIGLSRLYLGVHWPSDVVGGYLYGVVALAGVIRLRDWWTVSRQATSSRVSQRVPGEATSSG